MTRGALTVGAVVLAATMYVAGFSSCKERGKGTPAAGSSDSATSPAAAQPTPRNAFERDLQFVRSGRYTYVWVFSRRDGKPLDKDDADYLRKKAPQVVDWVTTDEGRKVIAGTNFDMEQGNMNRLRKRFVVEDHSGK